MQLPNIPQDWKPEDRKYLSTHDKKIRDYVYTMYQGNRLVTVHDCEYAKEVYPSNWWTNATYYHHPLAEDMKKYWLEKYPPCYTYK